MDQTAQPTSPTQVSSGATIDTGRGEPPSKAEVVLPRTDGDTRETPSATEDAYADLDYEKPIEEHDIRGITSAELANVLPDARGVAQEFGLGPGMELDTLGNNPDVLRDLARFGGDLRTWREAERTYTQTLPKGTVTKVEPLGTQALQRAIQSLIDDYISDPFLKDEILSNPQLRRALGHMAEQKHRYRAMLPALEQATRQHRERQGQAREAQRLETAKPEVKMMSEREFESRMAELFEQRRQADTPGKFHLSEGIDREIERLQRARWR